MRHALLPGVSQAVGQSRFSPSSALLQALYPTRQWHDDIVVGVHVMAGFGSRCKAPLRHPHPFVLDLVTFQSEQLPARIPVAVSTRTHSAAVALSWS